MNWKFWSRCGLTPERMEEICSALEAYLRTGGETWKVLCFPRRQLRVASATARLSRVTGISFEDLFRFSQHVTYGMRKRLRLAGKEGTRVRIERRLSNSVS